MDTQTTITDDCAQAPAPTICNLIQSVQSEQDRAARDREQRVQELVAAAHQAAREQLAALYMELEPRVSKAVYATDSNGEFTHLRYDFDANQLAALDLAPFQVFIYQHAAYGGQFNGPTREWYVEFSEVAPQGYSRLKVSADKAALFFHAMREKILGERERERQAKIQEWKKKLHPEHYERALNENDADTALAALVELDSDKAAEWHVQHARLLAKFEDERRHAEYEARQAAERAAAKQSAREAYHALQVQYRDAYQEYWNLRLDVRRRNIATQTKFQAELDAHAFQVWTLEYGIVAEDEDETKFVKTSEAFVLNGYVQNQWGEYQVLQRGGEVVLKKFAHEVSLEAPRVWAPSEHKKFARRIEVNDVRFWASPDHPYQTELVSRLQVALHVEDVLPPPQLPQGLHETNEYIGEQWMSGAADIREYIAREHPLPEYADQNIWE